MQTMETRHSQASAEIAATAARIILEEGLEYGPAKRRAAKQLAEDIRARLAVYFASAKGK